jgi:hypothetical protein
MKQAIDEAYPILICPAQASSVEGISRRYGIKIPFGGVKMKEYISGIFLDFDNIYSSLHKANRQAANDFANSPSRWLQAFEGMKGGETEETSHRFVVRRCYMNPVGRVPGGELFSSYRQSFVRDGWEVIDTPPLTNQGKTSADIHIVMDVLDAVTYYPHVAEYIIMAADADFTPLITRLRKHMKKTIVYGAASTAAAYRAACDSVIAEVDFIQLLIEDEEEADRGQEQEQEGPLAGAQAQGQASTLLAPHIQPISPERVSDVVKRYFAESAPGYKAQVSSIGNVLMNEFGSTIGEGWLGYHSLSQLLKRLCRLQVERVDNRTLAWIESSEDANAT